MLNSQETRILWKRPMIGLKSREYISAMGKILLRQEFSDGLQISMNIKDITYTFDNSLPSWRHSEPTHKSFHAKS